MKVLVFSDSHGDNTHMEQIVSNSDIRCILHLGDNSSDAVKLSHKYPDKEIEWLDGNCDFSSNPTEKIIRLGGKRIFITHGHKYGVKLGYQRIIYTALEKDVSACFFGHTHVPEIFYEQQILFLNPGSISLPRTAMYASYGIAEISKNGIDAQIMQVSAFYTGG